MKYSDELIGSALIAAAHLNPRGKAVSAGSSDGPADAESVVNLALEILDQVAKSGVRLVSVPPPGSRA